MSADSDTRAHYNTRSQQSAAIEAVCDALHDRLDRNFGDTVGLQASALAADTDEEVHVVGQVLGMLADEEVPTRGLDVAVWSRGSDVTRWEVRREERGERE